MVKLAGTRDAFGEAIVELGRKNSKVVVLDADLAALYGVPTMAFWSRDPHPNYHHYDDEPRFLSDSGLAGVGNRAEEFVRFLGDHAGDARNQDQWG